MVRPHARAPSAARGHTLRRAAGRGRYIVDEVECGGPVDAAAKTVVLSSPTRSNYKGFLKCVGSTIRYMPVWSWQEIQACHTLLYADDPERPLAEVTAAFQRWGGVPRFVLEKLRDCAAQRMLDAAIATADLSALVRSVGEVDAAPETSYRVLHMQTQRPYVDTSVAFGSVYIAEAVLSKLQLQQREQLVAFLSVSAGDAFAAGVRGVLFEALAHRALRVGGIFRMRRLGGAAAAEEEELRLEACTELRVLKRAEDLTAVPSGVYCQPTTGNFPAVDAVRLPNQLFQMTVSLSHDVKQAALSAVLQQLPEARSYQLFFVVPEDVFHAFGAKNYVNAQGVKAARLDDRVQRVIQAVLCMPLQGAASNVPHARVDAVTRTLPPCDVAGLSEAEEAEEVEEEEAPPAKRAKATAADFEV